MLEMMLEVGSLCVTEPDMMALKPLQTYVTSMTVSILTFDALFPGTEHIEHSKNPYLT